MIIIIFIVFVQKLLKHHCFFFLFFQSLFLPKASVFTLLTVPVKNEVVKSFDVANFLFQVELFPCLFLSFILK